MTPPLCTPSLPDEPHALARELTAAVLDACEPGRAVARALAQEPGLVSERTCVFAAGKAALACAVAARAVLGDVRGFVAVPSAHTERARRELPSVKVFACDHPLPTARNVVASEAAREFLMGLDEKDTLVAMISGGASAYLTLPRIPLSLEDVTAVTRDLQRAGATIQDLNIVRSACENLKAGGAASACAASRVVLLLISDVVGDDPRVIGSGLFVPWSMSKRRANSARRALEVLSHWKTDAPEVRALLSEDIERNVTCIRFRMPDVESRVILSRCNAARAAAHWLFERDVPTQILSFDAESSAKAWAAQLGQWALASAVRPRACILAGEPVVHARGSTGRGGPSQEVALASLGWLEAVPGATLITCSTDGIDGPTDYAGAVVTNKSLALARRWRIDIPQSLRDHNATPVLNMLGASLRTGLTGTNVNHLAVLVISPVSAA